MSTSTQPLANNTYDPSSRISLSSFLSNIILDSDVNNASFLVLTNNTPALYIDKFQNAGINTTSPTHQLDINSPNGSCLRLVYNNTSNSAQFTVNSTGILTLNPSGSEIQIPFSKNLNIKSHNGTYGLKLNDTLVTASATQLNYVDVVAGTVSASKALVVNATRDVATIRNLTSDGILSSAGISSSGVVSITNNTTSTTTSTGALVVTGGIGIGGATNIGGSLNVTGSITGTLATASQTNITSVGTLTSLSTGSITLGGTAITSSANEINYLSGITLGTISASKVLTVDSSNFINSLLKLKKSASGQQISFDSGASQGTIYHYLDGDISFGSISSNGLNLQTNNLQRIGISNTGIVSIIDTTDATSTSTGSLRLAGGIGISKSIVVGGKLTVGGVSVSSIAWGTTGIQSAKLATTYTDTSSTGTVASAVFNSFAQPTLVSSNVSTFTRAATVYIANAPSPSTNTTFTDSYSLWIPSGKVLVGDTTSSSSSSTGALIVTGGVGIGEAANIGGSLSVTGSITGTLATASQPNITSVGTLTSLSSSGAVNITNNTASSTSSTGALIVTGGVGIGGALNVGGTIAGTLSTASQPNITSIGTLTSLTSSGAVNITNNTISTNTTTGALVITGGIGIGGATNIGGSLNVTGNITGTLATASQPNVTSVGTLTGLTSSGAVSITNNTTSSTSSTGALIVTGGVGIGGDLNVGGTIAGILATASQPNITSVGTLTSLSSSGAVSITNNTASTTTSTGALIITGGVGIGGDTNIGGSLNVTGNITGTLTTASQPNITSVGTLASLTSSGAVSITNNTASTTSSTGALVINGGVGIGGTLNVGGSIAGTLSTASQPNITSVGTLTGLTSSGIVNITNNTASTTTSTGALVINGGVGIGGALNVGGSIAGTLSTASQPNITSLGSLTGLLINNTSASVMSAFGIDSSYSTIPVNTAPVGQFDMYLRKNAGLNGNVFTIAFAVNSAGVGSGLSGAFITFIRTGSNSMGDLVFYTKSDGLGTTGPTEKLRISSFNTSLTTKLTVGGTAISSAAWGVTGAQSAYLSTTFTDTSSTAGTVSSAVFNSFAQPTLATTNTGITYTNAATVYIANAPVSGANTPTITNAYSLWVATGRVLIGDTSASSSTTSGALVVSGGIGVGGHMVIGRRISLGASAASSAAWGLNGIISNFSGNIFTDTSNANTTSSNAVFNSFGQPTLATTNTGITITTSATVYIAGAPLSGTNTPVLTNVYSLWIGSGRTLLGDTTASTSTTSGALVVSGGVGIAGDLNIGGSLTFGGTLVTATATELNYLDLTTGVGTADPNKALVVDSNKDITGIRNLTISGNLTVSGTTTTINSTNINIKDNILVLNAGPAGTGFDSGILTQRYQISNNVASGDVVNDTAKETYTLTANAASLTTIILPSTANTTTVGYYKNWWIRMTSGTSNFKNVRQVTAYDQTTRTLTLDTALNATALSGQIVSLYNKPFTNIIWQEASKRFATAFTTSDVSAGSLSIIDYANFKANSLLADNLTIGGTAVSAASWTTTGIQSTYLATTYTDTSSTGSATTIAVFNSFAQPTLATSNTGVTIANTATMYIANAPIAGTNTPTLTNAYSLWIPAGKVLFGAGFGTTNISQATLTINADTLASGFEGGVHGLAITAGNTISNPCLYMGADSVNGISYIQSSKSGINLPLVLNNRGGGVGIGLSNPSYTLDVAGSSRIATSVIEALYISSSNADACIAINNSGTSGRKYWIGTASSGSAAAVGSFYIYDPIAGQNRLTITSGGNVGIGTTIPNQKFDVDGAIQARTFMYVSDYGTYARYIGNWVAYNYWGIGDHDGSTGTTYRVRIGICNSSGTWTGAYPALYSGSYNNASDYRLKNTITPLYASLDKIMRLNPVTYYLNQDEGASDKILSIGFIAHELQVEFPEFVTGEKDGVYDNGSDNMQSVNYAQITAVLTKGMQEQQEMILELKEKNKLLEAQLQTVLQRLDNLESN